MERFLGIHPRTKSFFEFIFCIHYLKEEIPYLFMTRVHAIKACTF